MTDKEKARAYDEALERARKLREQVLNNELLGFPDQFTEIFPELRESEDERIRKEIVSVIQKHYPNTPESYRWISWLEKQKEQKPNNNFLSIEQQMEAAMIAIRGGMSSKSQEWSEEDEEIWNHIIDCAESRAWIPFNEISWLVAHKPQFYWKPSDEQMLALEDTLSDMPEHYKPKCTLETLLRDLKKLK